MQHGLARGRRFPEALARAIVALLLAWACALPAAADTGTEITQLRVERGEDGVLLSATVRFDLPPVFEEALGKGIPLYFLAEAVLFRDRWYWTDRRIATASRHMRLSFQPLTRRWRLQVSPTPIGNNVTVLSQHFDTREEALQAVQRISHWRIADNGEVDWDASHNVDFRFRLDVSQLPRPFQISAVGQSDWTIAASRNQRLVVEAVR
jgi:hypothetical protein